MEEEFGKYKQGGRRPDRTTSGKKWGDPVSFPWEEEEKRKHAGKELVPVKREQPAPPLKREAPPPPPPKP
ncbi:hypothetical protein HYW55_06735 [Candidatus Gottesmanbacteria bacterium]|nr:hypothetical protein [Candidatus Gottesmanbacteria bacterium]